jgi:hypothetical protein
MANNIGRSAAVSIVNKHLYKSEITRFLFIFMGGRDKSQLGPVAFGTAFKLRGTLFWVGAQQISFFDNPTIYHVEWVSGSIL